MTREEKLYAMKMADLAEVAEKLGIKINKKAAKSEAVEKILLAEEMNKQNEKELAAEEKENAATNEDICADGTAYSEIGKEIVAQATEKAEEHQLVQMPGTEDSDWGKKHWADAALMNKFVKKAQKLITSASHDKTGYHVTIMYDGKTKSFNDKNLQNIRSEIGFIYRGEKSI